MNILLHRIEESSKIDIENNKQSEEKVINKVEEINTNVLLDIIHRNTNIKGIKYEIDKKGIYTEHLYIQKNDKIIFLQDPDFVNKIDIEKVFKGIKDKVELQIRPHFMSGKQYYIPKDLLSKDIIKQIKESY